MAKRWQLMLFIVVICALLAKAAPYEEDTPYEDFEVRNFEDENDEMERELEDSNAEESFQDLVARKFRETYVDDDSESQTNDQEEREAREFEDGNVDEAFQDLVARAFEEMYVDENSDSQANNEEDAEEEVRQVGRPTGPLRQSSAKEREIITRRCQGPSRQTVATHCARYLECSDRLFYGKLKTCPKGEAFDHTAKKCRKFSEVNCSHL